MFSKQDHENWQAKLDQPRCILVLMQGWNGFNVQDFYFSSVPYQTKATDSIKIGFDARLDEDFTLNYAVPFLGETRQDSGMGDFILDNADGKFDYWIDCYFKGYPIHIAWGDPNWELEQFLVNPLLLNGVIENVEFVDDNKISVKFADQIGNLNKPIHEITISNDVQNESVRGTFSPLAFGHIRNAEPILLDAHEQGGRYKWHTGQVEGIISLKDRGVELIENIDFTAENQKGEFVLHSPATGSLTLDGKGAKDVVFPETITQIAFFLISNELPNSQIDTGFANVEDTKPYQAGLYFVDKTNLLDVLDALFTSIGGFYFSDLGVMKAGLIVDPVSQASMGILKDAIDISVKPLGEVYWRLKLGYNKNNKTQSESDLAPTVSTDMKASVKDEYLTVVSEDQAVKTIYKRAIEGEQQNTCLISKQDAQAEANAQLNIRKKTRFEVTATFQNAPLSILVGTIWTLYDQRYGLRSGKNIQLLKITKKLTTNEVQITGWF